MKTVQDFLREVDDKELADAYFSEFPIEYAMIPKTDLTLGEIRDRSRTHFLEFVHRMRETKTEPGSSVFFACKYYTDGYTDIQSQMCELEDLRTQSSPKTYSCLFSDFSSVLGNYIAETALTKKNLVVVLAQILYEMSFFGYDQETMEKERKKLEEAEKEIRENPNSGIPFDEACKRFGWERPGEEEQALKLEITKAEHALNQFYFHREIEEIQQLPDFQR